MKLSLLSVTLIFSLAGACGAPSTSHIDVANGLRVNETYEPAVHLFYHERADGRYICTGTFISSKAMLTAAHCVGSSPAKRFALARNGVKPTHVFIHQHYASSSEQGEVNGDDLAILMFPAGTSKNWKTLRTAKPKSGEAFEIIGYGNNVVTWDHGRLGGSGSGLKRSGRNHISSVQNGMILFTGFARPDAESPGEHVLSGSGDSGGPLLIDGLLAGVTSGGSPGHSSYVDLNSESSRTFLRETLNPTPAPELKTLQQSQYRGQVDGRSYYQWSVRLTGDLAEVRCVTWQLHPSFAVNRIRSCERGTGFALESSGWGGFAIRAEVEGMNGDVKVIDHQLVLQRETQPEFHIEQWLKPNASPAPTKTWGVWIGSTANDLKNIACVRWILHPTFEQPKELCKSGSTDRPYELVRSGYGPFTIKAQVRLKDGQTIELEQQLRWSAL